MSIFVYITDNCREDATTHSLSLELERFKENVERTQSTSLFDHFPPPYLVKKKLGKRQCRLIADLRVIGEHAVIVFLAIMIRSSRAYEVEFSVNPSKYGDQHFRDLVTEEELADYIDERTKVEPIEKKPTPSTTEYGFLYAAFTHHQDTSVDDLIYETSEWIKQVSEERISKQLTRICSSCMEALSFGPGLFRIPVKDKAGWEVFVWRQEKRLLLISIATEQDSVRAEEVANSVVQIVTREELIGLLKVSRRAYKALILADEDLWIDLEKDPLANMALSPEESEVLDRARGSDHPFPLFINGRAGSGKSTILQYLFSDLLFHYLTEADRSEIEPPVYLTANGDLLSIARNFVERLLRSEDAFISHRASGIAEINKEVLDAAFCEFQPHLLSLIPVADRNKLFSRSSRIDYARFRSMWMERFSKDQNAFKYYSPDLSWHVIRSYIKGMSSETYLEPDEYAQLPENQLTVTQETFKLIFEKVWSGWYEKELEAKGLWDDQDLARYILDNGLALPKHPAVFCDEAQDFTRVELELLLRINLFSNRTLASSDISHVPFAFAGDQFQTLNPTGFRWDAIKASFVEKFIFELDPTERSGRTDLNYHELQYNYRSTPAIVRFGNHVQVLRAALFGLTGLKPQTPWASESGYLPVVSFRSNNGHFWKKFREDSGFIVIVPCGEGEEQEFVKNDSFLREHIKSDDGIPLNVLSAVRAKGCEYKAVIVYGFGEALDTDLIQELNHTVDRPPFEEADKSLPVQYFINRVYVAVSRAKKRLVVVDTEEGFKRIWNCAQRDCADELLLKRIKNGHEIWGSEIGGLIEGNPDDLTMENAGDLLENAKSFEEKGIASKDAFLLKQASMAYRSAGDTAKERECRARFLEAEGNLYEAGETFFDAGFAREGVLCLWRSGRKGWESLVDKLNRFPGISNDIEYQWAKGIVTETNSEELDRLFAVFIVRLDDPDFRDSCIGDAVWNKALDSLLGTYKDLPGNSIRISEYLDSIRTKGFEIPPSKSANVYYAAERFEDAVALWEMSGATKSKEYIKAKASLEPYPQKVLTLMKLQLKDEVVKAYHAAPDEMLTPEQADAIIEAFLSQDKTDEALKLAIKTGYVDTALHIALFSLKKNDIETASKALTGSYSLAIERGQWELVLRMIESKKVPKPEWNDKQKIQFTRSEADKIYNTIVRALARSEHLVNAPDEIQKRISAFLRDYLRVKKGTWKAQITIQEAGAAIERAGRFTDAISFYEAVIKDTSGTKGEHDFARHRLLINKHRQIQYEQTQADTLKIDKSEILGRLELEKKVLMKKAGIRRIEEIDQFPILSLAEEAQDNDKKADLLEGKQDSKPLADLTDIEKPIQKDKIEITLECFRIDVSHKNKRINITNTETYETAYLLLEEGKCAGEMEFQKSQEDQWTCNKWKMSVSFPTSQREGIAISSAEMGVTIFVQV